MLFPRSETLLVAVILAVTLQDLSIFSVLAEEIATDNKGFWSQVSKAVTFLVEKCLVSDLKSHNQLIRNDNAAVTLEDCLKRKGLRALDRALNRDVIAITENVFLVKRRNATEIDVKDYNRNRALEKWKTYKSLEPSMDWNREFAEKIAYFFKTRVLQITFKGFNRSSIEFEPRHGKRNNIMGQMLMFGLVAAGFIVIPLGFQFLAVLGGKALLLAKLALLLTSIQGLKKIATSHVNYGLYSTGHAGPWHYDRQWHFDGDPYASSFYSPTIGAQIGDSYVHSSVLPPVHSSLHPRAEEYLASY